MNIPYIIKNLNDDLDKLDPLYLKANFDRKKSSDCDEPMDNLIFRMNNCTIDSQKSFNNDFRSRYEMSPAQRDFNMNATHFYQLPVDYRKSVIGL